VSSAAEGWPLSIARDLNHGRLVAIKVLRPTLAESLGPGRFLREIRIASGLTHPNILPLHESGEADGLLFYVMPYVAGESLRDRLRREGQLPISDAIQIAQEVAHGLAYAHAEDIVHRDVKPENILLESGHAVVADFGLARAIHASALDDLSSAGLAVGTPAYMSPEQAGGGDKVDGRSDVYGLGCVLYEMLAGEPPFTGNSPQAIAAKHLQLLPPPLRTVRPSVPDSLQAAINRALEKIPGDRFQTAEEFGQVLAEPGHSGAGWKPGRGLPTWLLGGGISGLLGLGLLLYLVLTLPPRSHGGSASPVGLVLIPFEDGSSRADSLDVASPAPHTVLADALAWLPGVRPLDGTPLLGRAQDRHAVPLAELLQGARRIGGRYLLIGAIYPVSPASGLRVTVDLYAVDDGERVMKGQEIAQRGQLEASLGRLALESVRALAPREGPALGSRATLFSATSSAEAVGHLLQGQLKFWSGDYDGAVAAFRRAVEADSACGLAYHRLSVAELWSHDFAAALNAADAGLNRAPELAPRWVDLLQAQRQYALRQGDSAIAAFQRTVLQYPDDIDGWLGLGDVLFHFAGLAPNIPMDAQRALGEVISLDSSFAPIYDHLADLALLKGDGQGAWRYVERIPRDFTRLAREAALTLLFGDQAGRRAALERLRKADRQTISELVHLLTHGSSHLPLADTVASFLMEADRTPDDRRRGAEYRLAALSALGRPEEGLSVWQPANDGVLDGWVLQAYFAGYPVSSVAEPMLSAAQAAVSRAARLDLTRLPTTELIQSVQALVHKATLEGDSSEVLTLLSRVSSARGTRDSSDPLVSTLTASLQARLALLARDTASAINLLDRSVGRSLWPYTDFFPLSGMAPQRLLLGRLLASQGQAQAAKRWLDSFSNSWAIGDLFFVAPARQVQAAMQ
jgi:tetratricopeptide (TPR) repeat protein